jgi:hypothetical protein
LENIDLLKLLLPDYLVEYFDVLKVEKKDEELHLFFEEKNQLPLEFKNVKHSSKGFFDEIIIQDFPIRGQHAFLHIKRRRWLNHQNGKVEFRNWSLISKGTRITAEFASFLKEIGRI